jgi:hypothetical protein
VDAGLLEAAADDATIQVSSLNARTYWNPTQVGCGQAVIVLGQYLYALFIDSDSDATIFGPSMLFRLNINSGTGAITYQTRIAVGPNAQSIIPVNNGGTACLFVPAIGGRQDYGGQTNGTDSNICYVEATGTWPSPIGSAPAKVTCDPMPTSGPALTYDIHAVAAAMRDGSSALFILTQIYDNRGNTALWRIYRTTVANFLSITDGTTLSAAVTAGKLTTVDEGSVSATTYSGIVFWDMLYEQTPDAADDTGDRVWVGKGTPIVATRAEAYGSPSSASQNPYIEFGYIGGNNINFGAFDLLIETINQAKRGVSLKRTLSKSVAPKSVARRSAAPRTTEEDTEAK